MDGSPSFLDLFLHRHPLDPPGQGTAQAVGDPVPVGVSDRTVGNGARRRRLLLLVRLFTIPHVDAVEPVIGRVPDQFGEQRGAG